MKKKFLSLLVPVIWFSLIANSQEFEVSFEEAMTTKVSHELPDIAIRDTIRLMIIEKAQEYIGVNYKWGHANEKAFDCSGYVKYIYGHFGYMIPRSSYDQYNASKRLSKNKAKPGDLVFFITRGHRISHVGIYLGNNSFIHAPSTGKQVRIESLDTEFFRKNLAGFGTIL